MKIGRLSELTGVSASSIRYYEKENILSTAHRKSGIRHYTQQDVNILSLVKEAKAVGFSLKEIKALIQDEKFPLLELVQSKLKQIENAILEAMKSKEILENFLTSPCIKMDRSHFIDSKS